MKRSLLYIVQMVLSKLDFDEVNSLNDTPESIQIADEAEVTFYDLMSRNEWPHVVDRITVNSVSDASQPTTLQIPVNVTRIDDIRYDITGADTDAPDKRVFRNLKYLAPEAFLDLSYSRNTELDNVQVSQHGDIEIFVINDQSPTYWTSFDNEFIIFDSLDRSLESTIIGTKANVRGITLPEWSTEDTFIPDIPTNLFSLFLAEVTAACSLYWKQQQSPEDERRRNRGISRARRTAYRQAGYGQKKNYGRGNGKQEAPSFENVNSTPY